MSFWERWADKEQARAERANREWSNENYEKKINEMPGPRWAWALGAVPVLHWIGDAAIAWDTWRRRRTKRVNEAQ